MYAVSGEFTLGLGVLVLAVSAAAGSGSPVRAVEERLSDRPVRSAAVGIGTLVGGVVGIVLLTFALLVAVGLPEPVALLVAIPFFGAQLFVSIAATVGAIAIGSFLLRRLRGGESSLWLALAVGALVVTIPVLNFPVATLALAHGTGAMIDYR